MLDSKYSKCQIINYNEKKAEPQILKKRYAKYSQVLNAYIKNNKPLVTRIMLEFLNRKFDYKNDLYK